MKAKTYIVYDCRKPQYRPAVAIDRIGTAHINKDNHIEIVLDKVPEYGILTMAIPNKKASRKKP